MVAAEGRCEIEDINRDIQKNQSLNEMFYFQNTAAEENQEKLSAEMRNLKEEMGEKFVA